MPAERIAMRQVREVLRLKPPGCPASEIARRVGVAASTVRVTLSRFEAAGLSWPLPDELTDARWRRSSSPAGAGTASRVIAATPSRIGRRFIAS